MLLPNVIAQNEYQVSFDSSLPGKFDKQWLSFSELPDAAKLFYITSMSVAFFSLLKLLPFMLGKIDDLLKNPNRSNIFSYINANPGSTIAQVSEAQQIDRATVKYHLYKLESEGKIVFRKMGKYSRLFRNSHTYSDEDQKLIAYLQNRNSRAILQMILDQPGITNQELTERLGIEKSAVHWHVEKFIADGLVSYDTEGKFKRYYVPPGAMTMVQKHTEQALT